MKTQVLLKQQQPGERQHVCGSSPSRAWVAKAHIESHVETTSSGGEVEGGVPTSGPNTQKLCQGSLDEVVVVHLKQGGSVGVWYHLHRQE